MGKFWFLLPLAGLIWISWLWINQPPGNFVWIKATVVYPSNFVISTPTKIGNFTVLPDKDKVRGASTVKLEDGTIIKASGIASSDLGDCKVGQVAIARAEFGVITHKLIDIFYVDCNE